MSIIVSISTTADGNMYNRHHSEDITVVKNRTRLLSSIGSDIDSAIRINVDALRRVTQQHETNWCRYREVTQANAGQGMRDGNTDAADGLVTRTPGIALFLPVADCIGTAIYDPIQRVLMVSHLGRHSLEQNGAQKSINHLVTTYGCKQSDLRVWLTPAAGKQSFRIWALDNKGLKEVAFEQLKAAGILKAHIVDNSADTTTDENYYSYSEFLQGHRSEDSDYAIVAIMAE